MKMLTKNFSEDEMRCKCGCGICNVSEQLMNRLQLVRNFANIPLIITSGCRCLDYNRSIGSKDTSDHVTTKTVQCEGVDIACVSSTDRFKILEAAILANVRRIGISFKHNFIHLGMKKNNPQCVIWGY